MNGPNNELRASIFDDLDGLPNFENDARVVNQATEARLEEILIRIMNEANADVDTSQVWRRVSNRIEQGFLLGDEIDLQSRESEQVLAAVDQWTSLASYAVSWVYAPQSPLARKLAGWARNVAEILRKIANIVLTPLRVAAQALGASQWSVGASFPFGVSVSLTWP